MAAVVEIMIIERTNLIGLMTIYGWNSNLTNKTQWPNSKIQDKISQFKELSDDKNRKKMTPEQAKLEIDILAHFEAGGAFEVIDDITDEGESESEEKPVVKVKAEKLAKTPKSEPEESPESEGVENLDEGNGEKAESEEKPITSKTKVKHAKEAQAENPVKTKVIVDKEVREPKVKYQLVVERKSSTDKSVIYPEIFVKLRGSHVEDGALAVAEAKELIGWKEVGDDETNFLLKDHNGKKIQLTKRTTNRPIKTAIAERYASEMLRGKWAFNLESIVIDNKGDVQQGQHRLVGFILAEQERALDPERWGTEELKLETLLGFGADDSDDTADTYDTGTKRSLGDVLYRRHNFGNAPDAIQKRVSRIQAGALRLVWVRAGGNQNSFCAHFPHSEATEFEKEHPGILDCVVRILELDAQGNISKLLSQANSAALMYLMKQTEHEDKVDYFWQLFASGVGLEEDDPILTLRNTLMGQEAGGSGGQRESTIYLVVKAWNAWVKDEKLTKKELKLKRTRVDGGNGITKFILAEFPCMGGIDVQKEVEAPKKPEKAKAA